MAGRVPSEEMCSVDEEEEEKCREMKVEVEEEEEEREGGGGGKEATRCRARREGKKTGVRERAVVISHSEGLGRGSEEGLLASSFCCESAKGPPVALLLGYGVQQLAANLRDSALRNSAECCASVPPTFLSHAEKE